MREWKVAIADLPRLDFKVAASNERVTRVARTDVIRCVIDSNVAALR